MRRTQIYLDEPLHRRILRTARAERRTAAALIREATARYLDEREPQKDRDPIRAFIGGADRGPADAAREHDRYLYGRDR